MRTGSTLQKMWANRMLVKAMVSWPSTSFFFCNWAVPGEEQRMQSVLPRSNASGTGRCVRFGVHVSVWLSHRCFFGAFALYGTPSSRKSRHASCFPLSRMLQRSE